MGPCNTGTTGQLPWFYRDMHRRYFCGIRERDLSQTPQQEHYLSGSSLALPCSSSLTDPITFSHAIWLLSEARKLLNRETFKGHSLHMCALYWSLLQRKDLLHIFSSRSGPPGDDSSIAMRSCLLMDSVSTFPLQILEDLISTL